MEELSSQIRESCPACGESEKFYENLMKDMKEKKLLPEQITYFDFQVREGIPLPPQTIASRPVGTELPFFRVVQDICVECGCVYAVSATRAKVVKSIEKPNLVVPGQGGTMPFDRTRRN